MKEKRKAILVSILGTLGLILMIVGATYAWFSVNINGDGVEVNVTTATVGPLYYEGVEITANEVLPGWESEDTDLRVYGTVTTSDGVGYTCTIENTGEVSDVEYRVSGDGMTSSDDAEWRSITDDIVVSGNISNKNAEDIYIIAIRFKETGEDQNEQQGKLLSVSVTCDVIDKSIDAGVLAYTIDGVKQTDTFPKATSDLLRTHNLDSITCTNGAVASWDYDKWAILIDNIEETPANCTVNFVSKYGDHTFNSVILADNPNVSTRETFNAAFEASNNGDTIYKQEFTQGESTYETYYFAGQVTNNYVKFGTNSSGNDLYWRIVRINEDGSVRLIYAGTSTTDTAAFINTSLVFNGTYNNSAWVGYMYQISGQNSDYGVSQTETIQHGNATSSAIKKELDLWYTNNLSEEDGYISKTAIYCNDRTVMEGVWTTSGNYVYYAANRRLASSPTPTYACAELLDRFTASSANGNGALTKPIGLITADEVIYAGGKNGTNNSTYYIADNAKSGEIRWWTMSPYNFNRSAAYEFYVGGSSGTGNLNGIDVGGTGGARPVISLKSCVGWYDGDGTSGSPYTVSLSESCALKEN